MIYISSSLFPDLSKTESGSKKSKELIVKFSYDNTIDETDGAMKSFQNRFSKKRGRLSIAAYGLLLAAIIVGLVFNYNAVPLYFALACAAFGLYYSLTDQRRTRKRVIKALEGMNPEEYCCAVYQDKIEIETIIKPKENEEVEEEIAPLKTVFRFGDDLLNFSENESSLLLIFNRRQIYCFPKRCMSKEQENTMRDFLVDKLER